MKIYIVEMFTAQYDNSSFIVKAFYSEDKANKWVDSKITEEDANLSVDRNCYIITEQELE